MQNVQSIPEISFAKGMDNKNKPEFVKKGYCVLGQNCVLFNETITKGPGYTSKFNLGNNKRILGGKATNVRFYIQADNSNSVKSFTYSSTGSANPIVVAGSDSTAGKDTEFIDCGTGVYRLNGTDAVVKLVGTVATTPAGIPIGKWGWWVNNRFYITGNSNFPYRLYYSALNTPDTFNALDYIDIFPDSVDPNVGLSEIAGTLVVAKKNRMVSFDGYTADDFTAKFVTDEFPNFGCTSHRSIINVGDDLYFMSFAGAIPHIRSLTRTSFDKFNYGGVISDDIEGTMKMLNLDRLDQVAGGFDGRSCWWAVPFGTSSVNNYVIAYDVVTKGWTVHTDIKASCWFRSDLVGGDRLYFGAADNQSKIYYQSMDINSKDGNPIDFKFISRVYRPEVNRKSKWKYLRMVSSADTNGIIEVSYSPDGYSFQKLGDVNSAPSTGVFTITFPFRFGESVNNYQRLNLVGDPSYTYQVQFTEESTGSSNIFPLVFPISFGKDTQLSIKEYELMYYLKAIR